MDSRQTRKHKHRLGDPSPIDLEENSTAGSSLLQEMAAVFLSETPRLLEVADNFLSKATSNKPAREDTEQSEIGNIIIDTAGIIAAFDNGAEKIFSMHAEAVLGRKITDLIPAETHRTSQDLTALAQVKEIRSKEQKVIPVQLKLRPLSLDGRQLFNLIIVSGTDFAVGDKQKRSDARYRTLVEQIPAVTFMASLDQQSEELYVSPQIENLLGFSPQEWLSDPIKWFHQIHPEDRGRISDSFAQAFISGGRFREEFRVLSRDKKILWVHCETRMIRDDEGQPLFLQGVGFDITESKTAEEKVRASLREKEFLLKEIHHRVKNNLQITSSLLRLQAPAIKDPEASSIFMSSESRIRSMALVHEKLYQSKDFSHIDFAGYIRDLTTYLARSYNADPGRIAIRTELQNIEIGIDQAVPCGLILNELLVNSIKHAFPKERKGEVLITFKEVKSEISDKSNYVLKIEDTGKGFPEGLDIKKMKSLGLQMVQNLAKQLDGKLNIDSSSVGTNMEVIFPKKKQILHF